MIWLSLKTYPEATGEKAVKLCQVIKKVSQQTGVKITPCAQPTDIYRIKQEVGIEVWAQHVDPIDPGRHFGWISPYSLKKAGATGTVINHAEHALNSKKINETLKKAKKHGLKTLVICETPSLVKKVVSWKPDYLAYEWADLIAGPKAMINEDYEGIKKLAKVVTQPFIIGAGIKTRKHVEKTLEAGADGVILASAVVKAKDPQKKLKELASGFLNE